jgi:hypothetical protein
MRDNIRRPLAGRRLASGLCQAGIREARKAGNLSPCRATHSDPARQGVEAIAELLTSRRDRVPPHTHDSSPQDPNFAMLKPNILPVLGSEPLPTPKASAGTTSDLALHRNKIAHGLFLIRNQSTRKRSPCSLEDCATELPLGSQRCERFVLSAQPSQQIGNLEQR